MKETYQKPDIMFEDFSLSVNIAGNCERIVGNPTQGECPILGSGDVAVFTGTMELCDYTPESFDQAADTWDGFCYHVPADNTNLFNS